MRDDYLSADWANTRHHLNGGIRRLLETISVSLSKLNAVQYDAPWKREASRR